MMGKQLSYEELDINTRDILVPHNSYQRGLSMKRVKRIVSNFDERIANKPKVSYREGHYFVFDGQHTLAARKLCCLHSSSASLTF